MITAWVGRNLWVGPVHDAYLGFHMPDKYWTRSYFRNLLITRCNFDWHTQTYKSQLWSGLQRPSAWNIDHGSVRIKTGTQTPIASRSFKVVYQLFFLFFLNVFSFLNTSARKEKNVSSNFRSKFGPSQLRSHVRRGVAEEARDPLPRYLRGGPVPDR